MFSLSAKEAGGARGKGGASLSFIGAEAELTGDIATASHLHIDGTVHGDISCAALIQGPSGTIAGNVSADEVTIAGTVRGVISAARVALEATAKIVGDISYESLTIAAGAEVDGRFTRRGQSGAAARPAVQAVPSLFPGEAQVQAAE
ncbi:MAG: polymer-forming cytoskeletal protein [Alphaproteobacteria bacterium]|nr:MAG: polymer-forming cytoskeletal protein [Alphaproteobacteria bacterium]